MRTIVVLVFALGVLTIISRPVAADDDIAKEAFRKGGELVKAGDYQEAVKQFRIAYKHNPTWKLLYNIGQCEAGAKRYGLALVSFEEYLVQAGDDIPLERRAEVQEEKARLRTLVGLLKVSGPNGATIVIDGFERGTLPITSLIPVSAAVEHTIVGTLDGKKIFTERVTLRGEQEYAINITSVPEVDAKDVATDAGDGRSAGSDARQTGAPTPALKKWGVVLLVGGGVVLAGGLTIGGVSLLKARGIDSDNPDGLTSTQQGDVENLQTAATAGDVMMGIGGAALTTGIVLLIAHKHKSEKMSAQLVPSVGPYNGLTLTGSF